MHFIICAALWIIILIDILGRTVLEAFDIFPQQTISRASQVASGKEPACQCRRHGFNSWVRNIPWRRRWQLIPVFLPGENLMDRGAWKAKVHRVAESRTWLKWLAHTHTDSSACNRLLFGAYTKEFPKLETFALVLWVNIDLVNIKFM